MKNMKLLMLKRNIKGELVYLMTVSLTLIITGHEENGTSINTCTGSISRGRLLKVANNLYIHSSMVK
jgi:hypothetical protein